VDFDNDRPWSLAWSVKLYSEIFSWSRKSFVRNSPVFSVKRINSNGINDDDDWSSFHVTRPLSPESRSVIESDNIRDFIGKDSFKKIFTELESVSISFGYVSITGALSFSSNIWINTLKYQEIIY
jgi:hypothetical protein